MRIKLYSLPSDQPFMVTSLFHSGRITDIFITERFELPCILSSIFLITSLAVCDIATPELRKNNDSSSVFIDWFYVYNIFQSWFFEHHRVGNLPAAPTPRCQFHRKWRPASAPRPAHRCSPT